MKKVVVCDECDAEFKIEHDLEESVYKMEYCIFCGEQLSSDLTDDVESDEDEW
jgi:hypothetical protein